MPFNTIPPDPQNNTYTPPPTPRPVTPHNPKIRRRVAAITTTTVIAIVAIVLLTQTFYTLNNGCQAVVRQFGAYVRTETNPGLKLKIPFVETATIVNTEQVRREEFGFRSGAQGNDQNYYGEANAGFSADSGKANGSSSTNTDEAEMITSEESLVNVDWVVQYRISDSYKWVFRAEQPSETLRVITQAAYRRVVAAHTLDDVLTDQKDQMQNEVYDDLQAICNTYDIGISIVAVQMQDASPPEQVRDAFLDVTKALEDKNAKINEAKRYEQENLPVARGDAEAILNEAAGYKEKRINEATGIADRFSAIEREYKANTDVMRIRLYQEAMREVLPKVEHIYFVDPNGGTLQWLPLTGNTTVIPSPAPSANS